MNKHLKSVKALLDAKKANITEKLKASISDDVKKALEEALAGINQGLADLESAEAEASIEEIVGLFTKAIESLSNTSKVVEAETAMLKASMQASVDKLQAKIDAGAGRKQKLVARLSLKDLKKNKDFTPFSAAVDMSAWTPESEVDVVPAFHPLIGAVGGFEISTTAKPSIKVRGLSATGTALVVANHDPKPVIDVVGSQRVVTANTIAGVIEGVADEDLEDNPELEAELTNEALENLAQAENTSAIALLEASGQAFANVNFGTVDYADAKTALVAIVDQVKQALGNRKSEICVVANSSTWAKLKDLRNENGTPITLESIIGDIIAIEDNALEGDAFYAFAKKFVKMKIYVGAKAEWYKGVKTILDEDDAITAVYSEWRTDEQSIRVRERVIMYVSDTSVVVKGNISDVVAEITAGEEVPTPPAGGEVPTPPAGGGGE